MPVHQNKHGIESIVAEQMEEWAVKFQNHYDEKLRVVHREQKETLAIVNRLGKYVNNLELKVNSITSNMKSLRNENGEIDFPPENDYHSPIKHSDHNLDKRLNMLENFCGYDPEKEAYAALGLGNGDLLLPEHKLSNRLDKLEKTITKLDRNIRLVENEVGDLSPEKNNNNNNYNSNSGNHTGGGNGVLTTGLFFPERARPKSTHGDPRYRPNTTATRGEMSYGNGHYNHNGNGIGNGNSNGNGQGNLYTTPHPPSHTGTFGYRSAPNGKSRNVSRPSSAPNVNAANKGQMMQKVMEDIRSQIEEVDEKNNMQNTFLMNELMENVNSHEDKTDRKLKAVEAKLRQYVNEVEDRINHSMDGMEQSVRGKVMHMETTLLQLQKREQVVEERVTTRNTQQAASSEQQMSHQKQEFDRMLEEKESRHAQQQHLFEQKERDLQRELQNKENELRNIKTQNSATQDAYDQLQAEARSMKSEKNQMIAEHVEHIKHLEKDFAERHTLVDERTALYKAETQRLKAVHQDLQNEVNAEIKQRTRQLENEKQQLEQKLLEETKSHNLQAEKDRVIKDSLQSEIEMFKKSCNQAHQDKDQILSKLRAAEARYQALEAKLQAASPPPGKPKSKSKPGYTAQKPSDVQVSPLSYHQQQQQHPDLASGPPREGGQEQEQEQEEEQESDQFAYDTPVSRLKSEPSERRMLYKRADTPIPQPQARPGKTKEPHTPTLHNRNAFLPTSNSHENENEKPKPSFVLSPDTAIKRQGSKKNVKSSSFRGMPEQEVSENNDENSRNLIGVAAVDDGKLQEMVQSKLTQNDIDDIIVLEELIREKEGEVEQASAAKSRAKKKIKNWMGDFQKTHKRPPNQNEKEGVSELYLNHQKVRMHGVFLCRCGVCVMVAWYMCL
jgi:hypothetical protein